MSKYYYKRHMGTYNIYREEKSGAFITGVKVDSKIEEEDARREVYRLNGWEYKPKQKQYENT